MSDTEKLGENQSELHQESLDKIKVEEIVENAIKEVEAELAEKEKEQENCFEPKTSSDNNLAFEDPEAQNNTIKQYQRTLQELKEEISRLTKKLHQKSNQSNSKPNEEETFKLKFICKSAKQEVKDLTTNLETLKITTSKTEQNLENLKSNSLNQEASTQKIADLSASLNLIESEHTELRKSNNEISIADLDKILSPEANQKQVNEFFVNVQKRLTNLESDNSNLSSTLKKNILETNKLKEKCEKASSRYKSNDELKSKLNELENTYMKYCIIEEKINHDIKSAEEEYDIHFNRPENKHDTSSAQKMLDDLEIMSNKDKDDIEQLEFQLQEKRNMLRAARAYGLQRSKTSSKLRSDMELLGYVLVEKDQLISRLKKNIDEIKLKQMQIDLEIKNLSEKIKQF
ncbi:hypothetical protein SteCoe_30399 [Stentor coeruleus]|uniref:Uncharacterized protein n=1 Tax=Stentor coeruleus TaxID=5963 RepID=A0A1R2B3P9_9CILI|nr:hypothetical protein SteCoe_30423 [Stentor coeruleus]OMJ71408.1 hypothetical protein SteCoe_30399 [Stentor coeruleus]